MNHTPPYTMSECHATQSENAGTKMKSVSAESAQSHLTAQAAINLGSFYTPAKYITLALEWLRNLDDLPRYTIMDPSCGYGAFLRLSETLPNRFIGNDIDADALRIAHSRFPNVELFEQNKFKATRAVFKISSDEPLIIVGNPPYNDVTSQINAKLKSEHIEMDADLRTRDLGMSSLRLYNRLQADYVLVLTPLSYLIKPANFSVCRPFFGRYKLVNNLVFSSCEFAGTGRANGFPIIIALYRREKESTISHDDIKHVRFNLSDGKSFSLNDFDYVTDHVDKYPRKSADGKYFFYTLRDINALRRSRTFVSDIGPNRLAIDESKLNYYHYIDCFKAYCKNHELPFWMGNLDVVFDRENFHKVEDDICTVSRALHPDIFEDAPKPSNESICRVEAYITHSIARTSRSK